MRVFFNNVTSNPWFRDHGEPGKFFYGPEVAMRKDKYPTRLNMEDQLHLIERQDPVIWGQKQQATDPDIRLCLDDFEREGFCVWENFLSTKAVRQTRNTIQEVIDWEKKRKKDHLVLEPDNNEVRSVFDIHRLAPHFFEPFQKDQRLQQLMQLITGSDSYIHQSRVNFKPAFKGKGFYWHSDFETWHAEDGMPRMRCASVIVALTDFNHLNGSLMFIPKSHRWFVPCYGQTPENHYRASLKDQKIGVPETHIIQEMAGEYGVVAPEVKAGGLIVFDCNLLHGSPSNMSPFSREGLFFVCNSVANQLEEPFASDSPRPDFLAHRRFKTLLSRTA